MYKFRVYHRNAVKEDPETGKLVLDRNEFEQFIGHSVGHSIVALYDGTTERARGLYPNNKYKDEAESIELAKEYQEQYPDEKVFYVIEFDLTKEQYEGAWNVMKKFEPYVGKNIPKEVLGGMYIILGKNCADLTNTVYRGTGLPGNFTDQMTTPQLEKIPGAVQLYVKTLGGFGIGDKSRTVLGKSVKDVAEKYNVPESRVSQRESIPGVPYDLAIEQEAANQFTFVIAPNPKLVASAASEVTQIDEHLTQLAVTEDEGLQEYMGLFEIIAKTIGSPIKLFHSSKNTKILDCGVDEKGKLIEILFDYNNNAQWTCADEEMWFPKSDPSNFQPFTTKNIYEAIAHTTEGRYTAQDLINLQRSNFQAITATSQVSMLTSDGDKKPAFDQNSTPSTASDSEEGQQHSAQQNTMPLDPEYKDFLSTLMALSLHPSFLKQVQERNVMDSEEAWKKASDAAIQAAMARLEETDKTSKVKSIIESALKAFKEKFEAIRDKFTKKLKDDIEKTAKDASDSQQNGQAEYDAKAKAIHQQKAQEIEAMRGQLQSSYESQVAAIEERKKGEIDAFFQQGQAECDAVFAARSGAASNQPSSSLLTLSYVVSNSDVVAQKNAELSTFKAQKIAEMETEQQALLAQTQNQLKSFIDSKEAEAEQQCNALKSSIEQRLKSTQESKIKQIAEAATNKEKAQVTECNRKIKDIQENTDLIERLKEAVGNSGDAEALINKELNVFLQGAASDFGVDAEIL